MSLIKQKLFGVPSSLFGNRVKLLFLVLDLACVHVEHESLVLVSLILRRRTSHLDRGNDLVWLVLRNPTNCNCAALVSESEPAQLREHLVFLHCERDPR